MMSIEETAATWRVTATLLSVKEACSASPATRTHAVALHARSAGSGDQAVTLDGRAIANGIATDRPALEPCR